MAKLDFPAASASPFLAPNGVTYTYIGTEPTGHWSGTEADGSTSLEAKFVEITGDDMSGDLTLGTNKITLDAGTGAGTFAGTVAATDAVTVSSSTAANTFSNVNANGLICQNPIADSNQVFFRGRTSSGDNKVTIHTDGSASFANAIQPRNVYTINTLSATLPDLVAYSAYASQADYVSNSPSVNILSSGSAEFAGGASVAGGSEIRVGDGQASFTVNDGYGTGTIAGSALILQNASGVQTVSLASGTGSATFAGDVNVGDATFATPVVQVREAGQVLIRNDGAASTSAVWQVYNSGTGVQDVSSQISFEGNATFAGTITAIVVPPSDARFKENITPAKPQLADVVALGGLLKNYDWNDQAPLNEEIRSQRQLGLIAQEAAEVCPAIVKDIKRTQTVEVKPAVKGPKGAVIKEAVTKEVDDSYKGISQDALIMKLIGAVAELSAEVEALKAAN